MPWNLRALSYLTGRKAEQKVSRYFQRMGYVLLEHNYRCRQGEIDLIMQQGDEIVFIEVKYRQQTGYGQAIEYFHATKRKKFEAAVQHYLQYCGLNPAVVPHRIDVVAIDGKNMTWCKSV